MRRVLGGILIVLSVAAFVAAAWLHQPGFMGDPRVRLLDNAPFYAIALGALATITWGMRLCLSPDPRGRRNKEE